MVSDDNLRQVRVLHLVSSGGVTGAMQQALFMPLLMRMPKQRVKTQVISLAPGFTPGALLRQSGIPVHDISLSRRRFAMGAFTELVGTVRQFRPDVIQAWGHTAQLAALMLRSRCAWQPKIIWSVAQTAPVEKNAGLIDRWKMQLTARFSGKADHIVYASEAAASAHGRYDYTPRAQAVVAPGVDPMRFKPDFAARRKVRDQLGLAADAFVIGMLAPFQSEYDHASLIKGVGELIKTNPNISLILAGHGVQKGNAPLMALVGGGTLATRVHLLGEWSDTAAFFSACDVACSSALTDGSRMTLAMAMLCGVPCVATGIGAQGELLGKFGVAIEPGSPAAVVRGITRNMQLPPDRRTFTIQAARKHALANYVSVRTLQKYLQLYFDVVGRQALAAKDVPTPQIDESLPAPPADLHTSTAIAEKAKAATAALVSLHEISDPDSLEAQVPEVSAAHFVQQPPPAPLQVAPRPTEGDVLQIFESNLKQVGNPSAASDSGRARGIAEDLGDLLAPEELQVPEVGVVTSAAAPAAKAPPPPPAAIPPVVVAAKIEAAPVESAPVEAASVESASAEAGPVESARVEAAPVESAPVEVEPSVRVAAEKSTSSPPPAVAPAPRPTLVQLPMLAQEDSESAPSTSTASTYQLELLPDAPEERRPPIAAAR